MTKGPSTKYDPRVEAELTSRIISLKEQVDEAVADLEAYLVAAGIPQTCNQLGCDPKHGNLRCRLLKGHEGTGDAWSFEVERAIERWRRP